MKAHKSVKLKIRPPLRDGCCKPHRGKLTTLLGSALLCWTTAFAVQPATPAEVAAAAASSNQRFTLRQLGALKPFALRGLDGRDGVPFNVRADSVITKASLKLSYSYSPDLLADLSKINVLINGEVAASLPLPKQIGSGPVEQTVSLPPQMITEFNNLTLQLIGHYSMQCEDPAHTSLWATVSNKSVLELTTEPIAVANDLALLPEPFFDRRDPRPLTLPFVFANNPDDATLEAAGSLSSWFGALASYRGAQFPASINAVPASGHAIVLIGNPSAIPGLEIPPLTGPTLAIIANPRDPNGKLLLVMGRDGQELKSAAAALAVAGKSLSGQRLVLAQSAQPAARRPYDAPRWLRSDRAVKLGELGTAQTLNVSGYNPGAIAIKLRVPPDLFGWNDKGIPLDLKYRYTPQPSLVNSSLTIGLNDQFVKSLPLLPIERLGSGTLLAKLQSDETLPMQAKAHLPLAMLRPESQLQLRYMYDYIKQGECRDVIIDNVRGAIEPDSTLDISGYSHFLAMPDLAAFGGSGFPFTRLADLSQTAVVLPDAPNAQEVSAYLAVLGRLGESTGYPGTRITVTRAAKVAGAADKDLLLIASGDRQPLLKSWASAMPAGLDAGARSGLSELLDHAISWGAAYLPDRLKPTSAAQGFNRAGMNAYFAGFESPLKSGRSVVVVWGAEGEGLQAGVDALLGSEDKNQGIAGRLAIVRGKQLDSLVEQPAYHIGDLDWFTRMRWTLSQNLSLYALASALAAGLATLLVFVTLRSLSRKRLPA